MNSTGDWQMRISELLICFKVNRLAQFIWYITILNENHNYKAKSDSDHLLNIKNKIQNMNVGWLCAFSKWMHVSTGNNRVTLK